MVRVISWIVLLTRSVRPNFRNLIKCLRRVASDEFSPAFQRRVKVHEVFASHRDA
ncbi:MAG: hypothetical protein QOH71_1411 [Blastocatellia bacterium]|nr:hypothetical protein [Blastocatellia bacterium]